MTHPDGGPAFPVIEQDHEQYPGIRVVHSGMTLREWFAGKALQGMLASFNTVSAYTDSSKEARQIAQAAYLYADALLTAREET